MGRGAQRRLCMAQSAGRPDLGRTAERVPLWTVCCTAQCAPSSRRFSASYVTTAAHRFRGTSCKPCVRIYAVAILPMDFLGTTATGATTTCS